MANIFNELLKANKISLIKDGEKTIIACDAVVSENHQLAAEATQHEIEDGSDIHDHIINRGRTLSLEGIISDDPITILQTGILSRTIATATPGFLRSKLGYGISGDKGKPSKSMFDNFNEIYNRKMAITIVTGLKLYDNMVMEDFNAPRSSKTVRSLNFTATFRQIRIVSAALVSAPSVYQDVELGAQEKKNIGKQNTKSVIENSKETFTKKVKDWSGRVFKELF